MVVVKGLTTSTISGLDNTAGEIIYNTTLNYPIVNLSDGFHKFLVMDLASNIGGINGLTATTLTGTLQTAAQPNITSLGNLTGLTAGATHITSTAEATSSTVGGALTIDGGVGIAKSLYVGNDLFVDGNFYVSGSTTAVNSTSITIDDNTLLLNSGPAGSYDAGILMKRFQYPGDDGTGDVIDDTPKESHVLTADSGTTTIHLSDTSSTLENYYTGWWIKISAVGAANNEARFITAYDNTTHIATLATAFTDPPVIGDTVNLYNKEYTTMVWRESTDEFVLGYTSRDSTALDSPANTLNIIDYANLRVNNFRLASAIAATNSTTGSITTPGGIAISNTTDAVSYSNGGSITTAGGVAIGKSLYVKDNIFATQLTGTLQTAAQPNITSTGTLINLVTSGTLTVPANSANSGLIIGSTHVTASAVQLNYLTDISTPGTAAPSSAVVLDSTSNITGINDLTITGTLTAGNVAFSSGALSSLNTSGNVGINTSALDYGLEVNETTGNVLRLTLNDANGGPATTRSDFQISSTGLLTLTPYGPAAGSDLSFNIATHDGARGLKLGGNLVTALSSDLNLLTGMNALTGTATASKAVVLDASSGITGLGAVSATSLSLSSTLTSTSTTNSSSSATGAVKLSGGLGIALTTDATSATNGGSITTAGGLAVAKSLFVGTTLTTPVLVSTDTTDSTSSSTGAVKLAGGLGIALATDATSATNGGSITTAGGAAIAKALFVGTTMTVPSIISTSSTSSTSSTLGAVKLSGGLSIAISTDAISATNGGSITTAGGVGIAKTLYVGGSGIVSGDLTLSNHGTGQGLILGATLVTSTAAELNTLHSVLAGTASASSAVVLDSSTSITGLNAVSTTTLTLTGTTGSSSSTIGTLKTAGGISISLATDAVSATNGGSITTAGGVGIAKALFVGTTLTTPVLVSTDTTDSTSSITGAVKLSGGLGIALATDATSATNGGSITTAGGAAIAKSLFVGSNLTLSGFDGSTVGLVLGSTLVKSSANDINTLLGMNSLAGTATASKAVVLDNSKDISGINTLSLAKLISTDATDSTSSSTGAVKLAGGLGIALTTDATSATNGGSITTAGGVGIAKSLFVGSNLTLSGFDGSTVGLVLGSTLVKSSANDINTLLGMNSAAGTATASKAVVLDSSKNVSGINTLTSSKFYGTISDAGTSTIVYPTTLTHLSSNTVVPNFGVGTEFKLRSVTGTGDVKYGSIDMISTAVTDTLESGQLEIKVINAGTVVTAATLTSDILIVNGLSEASDMRIKENFVKSDIEESYNILMNVKMTDYNYINDGEKRVHRGVIAQELREVMPNAVRVSKRNGFDDFHSISIKEMLGHAICTIQYMDNKYKDLEKKYNDLLEMMK